MTVSKRFNFRPVWRGVRRTFFRPGDEAGSSLFEFAMVLPLMSMLLIGIIYGGITFYDYVTLADAVAVGAREMATNAGNTQACYLAEQDLLSAANSLPNYASQVTVSFPGTTVTGTYGAGNLSCTLSENTAVSVQATYPCNLTIPFVKINLCPMKGAGTGTACPYSYCISSTTTVRVE